MYIQFATNLAVYDTDRYMADIERWPQYYRRGYSSSTHPSASPTFTLCPFSTFHIHPPFTFPPFSPFSPFLLWSPAGASKTSTMLLPSPNPPISSPLLSAYPPNTLLAFS